MKNLVVLPAFNEERALPHTIQNLQRLPDGYELLVVDDGSRDDTRAVAEELAEKSRLPLSVVSLPMNCGIGGAVQTGYRFAARRGGYDYVVQFDADGQHDATAIEALVEECRGKSLDLCVGSRFLEKNGTGFRSTFLRRIGIRFFARLISMLARTHVTDPTSGFRCAGPRAWREFAERYPDDYPEPESLFWCSRNGLRIGEIPVRMYDRSHGVSSIRVMGSVYYMVKVTIAIVIDRLRRREVMA